MASGLAEEMLSESSEGSEEGALRCRICYETRGGPLVAPCACAGSMAFVHQGCLAQWLAAGSARHLQGCDVCKKPWSDDLVRRPSVRAFVRDFCVGGHGAVAVTRWFRSVANGAEPRRAVRVADLDENTGNNNNYNNENPPPPLADDDFSDADDDVDVDADVDGASDDDDDEDEDEDEHDRWGPFVHGGGDFDLLQGGLGLWRTAEALTRLVVWGCAFYVAVAQARWFLRAFSCGVKLILVLDSHVDALLIPGPVSDYLEIVFPGLPCLQNAVQLGGPTTVPSDDDDVQGRTTARFSLSFPFPWGGNEPPSKEEEDHPPDRMPSLVVALSLARRALDLVMMHASRHKRLVVQQVAPPAPHTKATLVRRAATLARHLFSGACSSSSATKTIFAAKDWSVDDVAVGVVALALNVRLLRSHVRRRNHYHGRRWRQRQQVPGASYAAGLALLKILCHPDAIFHDIATVVDFVFSSPLHVIHWLCVFPSYVYVLRLALARAAILRGDDHVLNLETGVGVTFHIMLLAAAAAAITFAAALITGLHAEYVAWARELSLSPLLRNNNNNNNNNNNININININNINNPRPFVDRARE